MWSKHAGIGEIRKENYYDPVKLALATGIRPTVSLNVSRLLCELQQLTQDDPLADILPAHGLHFTFLPLTLPLYNINEPLPANVEQLITLWAPFDAKKIIIRNLQLVALPGQLLLAGIPEHPAIALRHSFCDKVLESDWKHELLRRHTGSPLPAPFWHSTLLRYNAAFLPATLRQFFLKRQDMDFGDVTGELILAKVNYNWTQCYPLRIN
ncbi:hypothetical protein ACQ9OV_001744 [Cronobacter malonaticus]